MGSDFPIGERHECISLSMISGESDFVKYLVGCHHGRGRPLFPLVKQGGNEKVKLTIENETFEGDSNHSLASLDSGWIRCFNKIQKDYGHWFAAFLESIIRLADWEQSRREENNGN